MRDGWRETTLGSLLRRRTTRLGSADEPRILTVTEGHGLVDQVEHWGRRVATADVSNYKVVEPNDIVYNVYLLWNGAIGQNLFADRGVTSPVYEVFAPTAEVAPRLLRLILQSPQMIEAFDSISIGTIPRRRRAPWQEFLKLPVLIPPLDEQRRMVDLIGALDDTIAVTERQLRLVADALDRARDLLPDATLIPLSQVLSSIESGTSTKPVEGAGPRMNQLTLAAIRPGLFRPGEKKDVGPAKLPERARLRMNDLLITRSNTPDRVGYVALARDVEPDTFIPDLVWRLVPDEAVVSKTYLEQALSSRRYRAVITSAASGTSQSMRKINKTNFSVIQIPVPSLEAQQAYVAPLLALAEVVRTHKQLADDLHDLRLSLLTALLSGEHEIPESYDELMEDPAS